MVSKKVKWMAKWSTESLSSLALIRAIIVETDPETTDIYPIPL